MIKCTVVNVCHIVVWFDILSYLVDMIYNVTITIPTITITMITVIIIITIMILVSYYIKILLLQVWASVPEPSARWADNLGELYVSECKSNNLI